MLPLLIGGICAAVGLAAGAIASHAASEKDREAAKHLETINTKLINSRDALQKRYYELSDDSKATVSGLERKLSQSELEKDVLFLVIRLQNSLVLLMHSIDRNPSFNVLFQFREAVIQTNGVLTQLGEDLIPIEKDYFSRNLTRAKLNVIRQGESLTEEQKMVLHQLLPTVGDGNISCPYCHNQNVVMKNISAINCNACDKFIDLITWQAKICWT